MPVSARTLDYRAGIINPAINHDLFLARQIDFNPNRPTFELSAACLGCIDETLDANTIETDEPQHRITWLNPLTHVLVDFNDLPLDRSLDLFLYKLDLRSVELGLFDKDRLVSDAVVGFGNLDLSLRSIVLEPGPAQFLFGDSTGISVLDFNGRLPLCLRNVTPLFRSLNFCATISLYEGSIEFALGDPLFGKRIAVVDLSHYRIDFHEFARLDMNFCEASGVPGGDLHIIDRGHQPMRHKDHSPLTSPRGSGRGLC